MGWRHIEDTRPIARKLHRCQLCERDILPGSRYVRRMGFDDEGRVVMVMHEHCEFVTQSWDYSDWECGPDAIEFCEHVLGDA